MKKTIVIQIGNSDDKLSQGQWAEYVTGLRLVVVSFAPTIHFSGGSPCDARWQNFCIVGEIAVQNLPAFDAELRELAKSFDQESIAVIIGETAFVKGV